MNHIFPGIVLGIAVLTFCATRVFEDAFWRLRGFTPSIKKNNATRFLNVKFMGTCLCLKQIYVFFNLI